MAKLAHYTGFKDELGGYHAGAYDADDLPDSSAFLIDGSEAADVNEAFADITTGLEIDVDALTVQSMMRGAMERTGNTYLPDEESTQSKWNAGRKSPEKK